MDNTAPDRQWVTCPGCAEAFDPDTESPPVARDSVAGALQCPFCSTRFVPGPASAAVVVPEAIPSPVEPMSEPQQNEPFAVVDDDAEDNNPSNGDAARRLPYRSARATRDLSTDRVRNLSKSRRAMLRIRSWCVVATASFAVAVIQLGLLIASHLQHSGWFWKPVVYAIMLPAAAFGAVHFARRAAAIGRELRKPVLDDPATPPDFSTLSDGSQQWKKLEEM
jgi:hypothetical protein